MSSEYSSLNNYNKHLPGTVGGANPIFGTTTSYLQVVPEYKLQLGYDALTHGDITPRWCLLHVRSSVYGSM